MRARQVQRVTYGILTGVVLMTTLDCRAGEPTAGRTRPAAVAGQFYTGSAGALRREVEKYLAEATAKLPSPTRMIVSPHAGYVFSAPVAANAYAVIDRSVTTAILLGPSHHAYFEGISIADVDSYETPL
jgi:AmmeMemoRadiSam system protein B